VPTKEKETNQTTPEKTPTTTKVGNLTRDPELRFGNEKGTPFVNLGLAVNTPKVPGEWSGEQRTTFYDVVCFGTLAEHAAESLAKGDRVVVAGRPEREQYTDGDGVARERRRVVATAIGPDLRFATAVISRQRAERSAARATTVVDDEDF